jgi:type IV pilus assembly protein PilO
MANLASSFAGIAAKIQKIPTKTRLIAFGALLAVLAGSFIYFFHIPMTDQINTLKKDIDGRRATIQSNDEKIKKLDELKAEVRSRQDRLRILTEQLPPGSEVSGLLSQIQNLVSKSGLTLKLWRPGSRKTHPSGLYEEIPITVDLSGGYHDLALFLDRVSKLTRIVNMQTLKMSGAAMNKAGAIEIKINCTAMTFAAVEKKPDAAAPPKVSK